MKPEEVVKLVEKYFGSIPAGPAVQDMKPVVAKLDKDRYVSYEDNVRFPMLRMTFPTPEAGHKDEPAMDVLAEVLGQGKASILHKNFVKEQKANYYTSSFKNGLKLIGTKSSEIATVTIQLNIAGGHRLEANEPGKAGIASLTADLLNEDTEHFTAEEFSNELDKLGSSIRIGSGNDETYVVVQSLKKNLDKTLALVEERLFRPKFAQEDFDRLKKQQLEGIANQATQPTAIANNVYNKLLYGEGHIMAIPSSGTTKTVESITLEDVKRFYNNYYSPSVSQLVVVGDISEKELMGKLSFLKNWKKKEVKLPADSKAPAIDKTRIYFVDKPDAAQSEIRIGYLSMPFDATGEYYKAGLMNYALGGAFNSRINLNLREDKGYTYGARSYFGGGKYVGPFTASAGVRADASAESVTEFMKELTDFQKNGITEDEVKFMKSSIGQADARKYETPYQKAGFLGRILEYDLSKDYVKKQTDILNNISKKDIDALAARNLPVNNMHIVVVGDKKTALPKLQALNYEVVEVDADGN